MFALQNAPPLCFLKLIIWMTDHLVLKILGVFLAKLNLISKIRQENQKVNVIKPLICPQCDGKLMVNP